MRKKLAYLAIVAAIGGSILTVVSCAPDSPPTAPLRDQSQVTQDKLQNLRQTYGWIGKYHTDGLAYVYSQLAKRSGKVKNRSDACRIVAQATKEFHKAARHGEVPATLVDPALMNDICSADANGNTVNSTVLIGGSSRGPRATLSGEAQSYIDQIVYLASSAGSRGALVNGVQNIEAQAAALPFDEAGAVEAVASITLSSADYWDANLGSWSALSGSPATAYSRSTADMTAGTLSTVGLPTTGPRYGWSRGLLRVLGADAASGGRTAVMAWMLGPVGWDAVAASALWGSGVAAVSLLF